MLLLGEINVSFASHILLTQQGIRGLRHAKPPYLNGGSRLNKRGAGPLAGKFALAPMPGGKQILGLWDWAIPANSNTSDADWAFISWLTSKAGEKTRVIAGGAPTRNSVLTDPEVAKKGYGAAYYKTVGQILANSAPLCTGANCDEMIQAVGTELNAAVAGQKSINDALTTATTKANKIQAN